VSAHHDPLAASRYFKRNLRALLRKHRGKFALIHGDRLIAVFDSYDASVREGMRRYAGDGFLAREITDTEEHSVSVVTSAS
jgi:hypothetical protein